MRPFVRSSLATLVAQAVIAIAQLGFGVAPGGERTPMEHWSVDRRSRFVRVRRAKAASNYREASSTHRL
jgi:hypothetical protein